MQDVPFNVVELRIKVCVSNVCRDKACLVSTLGPYELPFVTQMVALETDMWYLAIHGSAMVLVIQWQLKTPPNEKGILYPSIDMLAHFRRPNRSGTGEH